MEFPYGFLLNVYFSDKSKAVVTEYFIFNDDSFQSMKILSGCRDSSITIYIHIYLLLQ